MRLALAVLASVVLSAPLGAQTKSAPKGVELFGPAGQHRVVTRDDLAKLPRVEAAVSSHNVGEKRPARWAHNVVRIRLVPVSPVRTGPSGRR